MDQNGVLGIVECKIPGAGHMQQQKKKSEERRQKAGVKRSEKEGRSKRGDVDQGIGIEREKKKGGDSREREQRETTQGEGEGKREGANGDSMLDEGGRTKGRDKQRRAIEAK